MLDEHGKELGIELGQHAPGLGGAALVDEAVFLPEAEEPLSTPSLIPLKMEN
jgi:hypothetical protein